MDPMFERESRNKRLPKRKEKEHVELEEFATDAKARGPARIYQARRLAKAEVRDKKLKMENLKLRAESS